MGLVLSAVLMTASSGLLSESMPRVGLLLGQAPQLVTPIESMSLTELTAERDRLMLERPSLGLGIALLVTGGAVLVTGLTVLWYASIIVGAIISVAAIPLLIIGPILLVTAGKARGETTRKLRDIDRRITQLKRDEVPPPPPLPPPPLPPVAGLPSVPPQLSLLSF
jgi:hypothetical protein